MQSFHVKLLHAFRDGKYSQSENVTAMNIFHHVVKPAIIARKKRSASYATIARETTP